MSRLPLVLLLTLAPVQSRSPVVVGWYGLSMHVAAPSAPWAIVDDVFPDGPAERAGLVPGDTLLEIGSRAAARALASGALDSVRVGDSLTVVARRGGGKVVAHLRAAPRPELSAAPVSSGIVVIHLDTLRHLMGEYLDAARRRVTVIAPAGFAVEQTDSALVLTNVSRHLRLRLDSLIASGGSNVKDAVDTTGTVQVVRTRPTRIAGMLIAAIPGGEPVAGVAIAAVDSASRFGRAGVRPLDIIRRINRGDIRTVEDLRAAVAQVSLEAFQVDLLREGKRLVITVPSGHR